MSKCFQEYFYMGTQLPLDRFLSFYYAHSGFHLNNLFIMLSIHLFLLVGANLAALTSESTICEYDRFRPITDPKRPWMLQFDSCCPLVAEMYIFYFHCVCYFFLFHWLFKN